MKVVRIFLKPGFMNWVDIQPTAEFDFTKFTNLVRLHGFQNESCCIPEKSIQCMMFNEKEILDAMNIPPMQGSPFPPRPN